MHDTTVYVVGKGGYFPVPTQIVYTSFSEKERDEWFEQYEDDADSWCDTVKLNFNEARENAIKKLNGIERLLLGFSQDSPELM